MKAPLETTFEILSNSDKRKACIGIALLGLSDVVVLEEPTRDLSPEDAKKVHMRSLRCVREPQNEYLFFLLRL